MPARRSLLVAFGVERPQPPPGDGTNQRAAGWARGPGLKMVCIAGTTARDSACCARSRMSVVDHSAAGPAAGYEQQRQLALVLLCEAYARDPAVRVRLEAIEDIDVVSDLVTIDARVQVKHHLADHTLTDATPELWRTLTVWMDLEAHVRPEALPRLHLVTTSVVDPDSAAALLGPEGRRVEAALDRLVAAAESSDASGTRAARERFLDLGQARQLQLLQAITVLDSTARVVDLGDRLRTALGLVVPSERPVEFLERVQGWWVGALRSCLPASSRTCRVLTCIASATRCATSSSAAG
jgi:hypothetical protein